MSDGQFHGIYPMLYAFFDRHGELDRGAMRTQVQGALAQGVHGIAVGGLATETNKLSTEERATLMAWAVEDVAGQVPLSVTIAESNVKGQTAMAQLAAPTAPPAPHRTALRHRHRVVRAGGNGHHDVLLQRCHALRHQIVLGDVAVAQ